MAKVTAMITITPAFKSFIEITLNDDQTAVTQLKINGIVAKEGPQDQCSEDTADGWIKYQGSGWCCGWKWVNGQLVYRCVPC
jgi:hypothetical protein